MPQLVTLRVPITDGIAHVARIHVVKRSPILPTPLHDFVFENTAQHDRARVVLIVKMIGVSGWHIGTGGQPVDVLILAVFAEKNPV